MDMKLNLQLKPKRKIRKSPKRSILAVKPLKSVMTNRRAVNAVISNIILIAAVIAVGFTVLIWSQNQSAKYQMEYSSDVNSNIEQIQEKVVFEYVVHNETSNELIVYLLNCGVQSVNITRVYVNTGQNFTSVPLIGLGTGAPTVDNLLHVREEAFFTIPVLNLPIYTVKIETWRGSTFVGSS
jgi:hypothetical protein